MKQFNHKNKNLLILSTDKFSTKDLHSILDKLSDDNNIELDIMIFVQDFKEDTLNLIKKNYTGEIKIIYGSDTLSSIDMDVKDMISKFISEMKLKLNLIALETGGKKWAKRFEYLWWKTSVSEKNSPSEPYWFELFKIIAILNQIKSEKYVKHAVICEDNLNELIVQIEIQNKIKFIKTIYNTKLYQFHKFVIARYLGLIFLLASTIIAKFYSNIIKFSRKSIIHNKNPILLYSWFPRVWTNKFGEWQDMYIANLPDQMKTHYKTTPTLILRIYDKTNFLSPIIYIKRLFFLHKTNFSKKNFVILESFGNIIKIITTYINLSDALRFKKMTLHQEYKSIYLWNGFNLYKYFHKMMWKSVLVYWPHLEILSENSKNVSNKLNPSLVLLYCFEFMYGKSIIQGTRNNNTDTPIIGMQHGPITNMKLLYSFDYNEATNNPDCKNLSPYPDIFSVDGNLSKNILKQNNIPDSKIVITGPARFDNVWKQADLVNNKNYNKKTKILIAPGLHDTNYVITLCIPALILNPDLEITIKLHPKVNRKKFKSILNKYYHSTNKTINISKDPNIYNLMKKTDIFVTTYSSTSVEALIFKLPVIILIPNHIPDMSIYHKNEVNILQASSSKQLSKHIEKIIGNKNYTENYSENLSKMLEKTFGKIDSKSTMRLAKLCNDISLTNQ